MVKKYFGFFFSCLIAWGLSAFLQGRGYSRFTDMINGLVIPALFTSAIVALLLQSVSESLKANLKILIVISSLVGVAGFSLLDVYQKRNIKPFKRDRIESTSITDHLGTRSPPNIEQEVAETKAMLPLSLARGIIFSDVSIEGKILRFKYTVSDVPGGFNTKVFLKNVQSGEKEKKALCLQARASLAAGYMSVYEWINNAGDIIYTLNLQSSDCI